MHFKIYRTGEEYKINAPSPCKNSIKVDKEYAEVRYLSLIHI